MCQDKSKYPYTSEQRSRQPAVLYVNRILFMKCPSYFSIIFPIIDADICQFHIRFVFHYSFIRTMTCIDLHCVCIHNIH
jgi:hypothetical protein